MNINIYDEKFVERRSEYGIYSSDCEIYDDAIIMNSPKKGIYIILDRNYNTIGIHKVEFATMHLTKEEIAKGYNELYDLVDKESGCNFLYPFDKLSLKQIMELSKRVSIRGANNGHSSYSLVNGNVVIDEENNDYIGLLSYINFLSEQVREYFIDSYHMKMLGFDYPNVYEYISNIMYEIDRCIDMYIKNEKRPFPANIIAYLGKRGKERMNEHKELYSVIELLLKQKGYKIKGGFAHYNEIEPICTKKEDLSDLSVNLLKILEMPEVELKRKQENVYKTMHVEEINLREYLEGGAKKDKCLSLK